MLADNPIIVNKKWEVIDGQHRLEVAKNNNLDIYFVVVQDADLDEVHLLNANNRSWVMKDYLDSYIAKGKQNYIALKEFSDTYNLPLSVSMTLLTKQVSHARGDLIRDFKNGDFKITDYEWGSDIADKLAELVPFTEGSTANHREFIYALTLVYDVISHKKLIEKLRNNPHLRLKRSITLRNYLRQFEDVINYKAKKRKTLYQ